MSSQSRKTAYPQWICDDCGRAAGGTVPELATYHMDVCRVCRNPRPCTEPRDWGYPVFGGKETVVKSTKKRGVEK